MRHRLPLIILSTLIILILLLTACSETTSTPSGTTVNTSTTSNQSPGKTTASTTTGTSTNPAPATTSTTMAKEAHWWYSLGTPKYGGSIRLTTSSIGNVIFDNYNFIGGGWQFWFETLWMKDWTLDRNIWSFNTAFTPE